MKRWQFSILIFELALFAVILVLPEGLLLVGGMEKGQQVTSRVALVPKTAKAK